MKTKQQAFVGFHNAVGEAITENLCDGNITRKDIMEADLWTPKEIADVTERIAEQMAEEKVNCDNCKKLGETTCGNDIDCRCFEPKD